MTTRPTGLLDASTVILLPRLRDPGGLPDAPLISAITLAELSVGPLVATTDTERAARLAHLQQAEADFEPLPFDADAARAFGQGPQGSHRQASDPREPIRHPSPGPAQLVRPLVRFVADASRGPACGRGPSMIPPEPPETDGPRTRVLTERDS